MKTGRREALLRKRSDYKPDSAILKEPGVKYSNPTLVCTLKQYHLCFVMAWDGEAESAGCSSGGRGFDS